MLTEHQLWIEILEGIKSGAFEMRDEGNVLGESSIILDPLGLCSVIGRYDREGAISSRTSANARARVSDFMNAPRYHGDTSAFIARPGRFKNTMRERAVRQFAKQTSRLES